MDKNWFLPQCVLLLHKRWLQSHTVWDNWDQPFEVRDLTSMVSQCIYRRQSDDRIQKKRKSEMERGVKKHFLVFVERENCHCQFITTQTKRRKWISCLLGERKSVFDKILIFIPTSYFSEKDYDVSVCGRLWCHSSMVVLELPSVLDTKQLVLHC